MNERLGSDSADPAATASPCASALGHPAKTFLGKLQTTSPLQIPYSRIFPFWELLEGSVDSPSLPSHPQEFSNIEDENKAEKHCTRPRRSARQEILWHALGQRVSCKIKHWVFASNVGVICLTKLVVHEVFRMKNSFRIIFHSHVHVEIPEAEPETV